MPAPEALVCDVQRFSLHDGPGIRTTVFFKGCPLQCRWCHNPEAVRPSNEPLFDRKRCVACGACVEACPDGVVAQWLGGARPSACQSCLACAEVCPTGAREPAALTMNVEDLLRVLVRDRPFYGDRGGVTLSGGEPLLQLSFLESLLPALRRADLHVAVQTCGYWRADEVLPLLGGVDLVLFDLKVADPEAHGRLTGRRNERILANLRRLLEAGRPVEVRMPVVPGLNTAPEQIAQAAALLTSLRVHRLTLVPYHSLGTAKWRQLGRPGPDERLQPPTREQLCAVRQAFGRLGVQCHDIIPG